MQMAPLIQGVGMDSDEIKEKLSRYYDAHAREREEGGKAGWKRAVRADFAHLLGECGCATLLEIGAGTGQDAQYFMEQGLSVTAIDLSDEHVRFCSAKGIHAVRMDFYHMHFEDGAFDALYALNCLLHVPPDDLSAVLAEIGRVVRKGGRICIGSYGGAFEEGVYGDRYFSFYEYDMYRVQLESAFTVFDTGIYNADTKEEFHWFFLRNEKSH
jgi:SAM-dependent methyltransferase